MKPLTRILLCIAMPALACPVGAATISATGWNVDFVLGLGETHATHDYPENGNIWFASDYGVSGGPGVAASTGGTANIAGVDFAFQDFSGGTNNAVRAQGTLTLDSPGQYSDISFLVANSGGNAGQTWNIILDFGAAGTENATYLSPGNWAGGAADFEPRLTGNGTNASFVGGMDVRTIDLAALGRSGDTLQSIQFLGTDGAGGNAAIFALSGTVIPEPSSAMLICLTACGLLIRRRRG